MKYKRVKLIVGSYVCPDTPEALERAREALVDDFSTAYRHRNVDEMFEVEEVEKDAESEVPSWLLEDLETEESC